MKNHLRSVLLLLWASACAPPSASEESPVARSLDIQVVGTSAECGNAMEFSVGGLITACNPHFQEDGCEVSNGGRRYRLDLEQIAAFYQVEIAKRREVKAMIFCPGFRVAPRSFPLAEIENPTTWKVSLVELPRREVRGVAVTDRGEPLAEVELEISYSLLEAMGYFGYADGSVPELNLGRLVTARDGGFRVEVPDLRNDPFIDAESSTQLVEIAPPHGSALEGRLRSASMSLNTLYGPELNIELPSAD